MRRKRPSLTAKKIARCLVYVGHDPELAPLLPAGAAAATERLLLAAGGLSPRQARALARPRFRRALDFLERMTAPGMLLYVGLRKRFVEDEVRAAIEAGATQVLVVGAGFDTLCPRLADELPALTTVEIDHPATHVAKLAGVEASGAGRPNLHLVPADLATTTLADALGGVAGWDRTAKSVVVAEGVLMYLDVVEVESFVEAVRDVTGAGSRFVFTVLGTDERGRARLGRWGPVVQLSLRIAGEPFRWAATSGDVAELLSRHGFRPDLSPRRSDLRVRYLEPAGLGARSLGIVESVGVAERVAEGVDARANGTC